MFACALAAGAAAIVGGLNYVRLAEVTRDVGLAAFASEARLIAPRFNAAFTQLESGAVAFSRMPSFQGIVRSIGNGGFDLPDGSTTNQWRDRLQTMIERHDGGIWLESKPGHGSTFYFTPKGAV